VRRTLAVSFIVGLVIFAASVQPFNGKGRTLSLDQGYWLTLPEADSFADTEDTDIIYARVPLSIVGKVYYASLVLSATDEFTVLVNGTTVASDFLPGKNLEGRFDIGRELKSGRNFVALKITGHRRQSAAAFRAVIVYRDVTGEHTLATDPNWQVTPRVLQTAGVKYSEIDTSWAVDELDVSPWRTPAVLESINDESGFPTGLPLYADFTKLNGQWFWPESVDKRDATLHTQVEAKATTEFSFGVAVNGSYRVRINGYMAADVDGKLGIVQLQDFSSFLQYGKNDIEISVVSRDFPPRLAVAGFAYRPLKMSPDYSDMQTWGVAADALVYDRFVDRAPNFNDLIKKDNWLQIRHSVVRWLKNVVLLSLYATGILAIYHTLYNAQLVQSLAAMAMVSLAIFLFWLIVLLVVRLSYGNLSLFGFGLSGLRLQSLNEVLWMSPVLTGMGWIFTLLIDPPRGEGSTAMEAHW